MTDWESPDDVGSPSDEEAAARRALIDRILDEELPRYAEALERLGQ